MTYKKKYPLPKSSSDFLLLEFERGYHNVRLFHGDREVAFVESPSQIKNGFKIADPKLGLIELTFSDSPITINVIVDGLHSPVNASNPKKMLDSAARIFGVVSALAILGTIIGVANFGLTVTVGIVNFSFDFILTSCYIIAAVFVGKGQPWAFYLGFSAFCFSFLLYILVILLSGLGFVEIIQLGMRAGILVFLIMQIKHVTAIIQQNKVNKPSNALLDDL